MAFNAPTMRGGLKPGVWDRRQQAGTQADGYDPALSAKIQALPSYQAWVRSLQVPGSTGQGVGGTPEWKALMADLQRQGINIPENELLDSDTGTVRGKTWMERHPVLTAVLITAGFAGGGAALGAAMGGGAVAGGAGAGVGLGETGATVGLSSGAGLPGAVTAGGAGASAAAGGGGTWSSLLSKYIIPGAATGVDEYLTQRNNDADRDQRLQVAQQGVGYDQSLRDPFRAQMYQANDVARLERMSKPPTPYGPASGSPYSQYMTQRPPINLSDDYLNTVWNAQHQISRGEHPMPNMVDPANWGNPNTQDLSTPRPASAPPATGPSVGRGPALPGAPTDQGLSLASLIARYSRSPNTYAS